VDLCASEVSSNLDRPYEGDRRSLFACTEKQYPLTRRTFNTVVNVVGTEEELFESWLCKFVVISETEVGRG